MRKWFSEFGEEVRKIRENHPVHWLVIVSAIAIVSGLCGIVYIIYVLGTNPLLRTNEKYDIFVTLFLIFFTILGLLGYGMYIWIRGKLESRLIERFQEEEQKIENRQNLHIARVYRGMGYTFWQLFLVWEDVKLTKSTPTRSTPHVKEISNVLIELARDRAERSLNFAKKIPKNEYKKDINQCKANWVYFLAEAARSESAEVTKQDKEQALIVTNEILTEVSKQDYPTDYYHYQESCAWALYHLSETGDKISEQKTSDIIRELLNDGNIPYAWREKQKEKWTHLFKGRERQLYFYKKYVMPIPR